MENRNTRLNLILWLIILNLMCFTAISAQVKDTIFGSLNEWGTNNSIVSMKAYNEFYYFHTTNYEYNGTLYNQFKSTVKTDGEFNVIQRNDVPLRDVSVFLTMNRKANYILNIHKPLERPVNYLVFTQIDLDNLQEKRIDSLNYPVDYDINFWEVKPIDDTTFFTFGFFSSNGSSSNKNFYLEFSIEGKILKYDIVDISPSKYIGAIHYIMDKERFFASTFRGAYYLFDRELNLIQKKDNEVTYKYNGISHVSRVDIRYIEQKGDSLVCVGKLWNAEKYNICKIAIPIENDTLGEIGRVTPLFDSDYPGTLQNLYGQKDSSGNLITVSSGDFNPFYNVVQPNEIYISKINQDYVNEWFVSFDNNKEFFVRGLEFVEDDKILVFGEFFKEGERFKEIQNFYLKINLDGTITSTSEGLLHETLVVYPNPTGGPLTVKAEDGKYTDYRVYDMQGRLLKQESFDGRFDISELQAGTYFLHFMDREGKAIGSSKVVKY